MRVTLSYRQYQTVRELTTDGADNATLARRLGLSVETIRSHLQIVYRKTGARDRTELAVMVLHGDVTFDLGTENSLKVPIHLAVTPPEEFRRASAA